MRVRVASAGTGKTTSLVKRYLELITSGVPLRRIAGTTFTRVAAAELRVRVGEGMRSVLGTGNYLGFSPNCPPQTLRAALEEAERELGGATLTTIHGLMIDALRLNAPLVGLDPNFSVLGEWEAEALFEEELKTLFYLAQAPSHSLHGAVAQLGSRAEGLLQALFSQRSLAERYHLGEPVGNPGDGAPTNGSGTFSKGSEAALLTLFESLYARYRVRLGTRLLAPPEVERRALGLIRHPQAMGRLRARYRVVLVDEFQDVNPLQGAFFNALEGGGLATEVVGDPKQSIYGFRHADVEVFRQALRSGEVLPPLTQTRRHARVLSRFLNHLTSSFAASGVGFLRPESPEVESAGPQADKAGRVEVHWVTGSEPIATLRETEAQVLAARLVALSADYAFDEMAVLARTGASLLVAEGALRGAGIPCVLVQGRGYFERLEIRDLYHALRVGLEPAGYSLAVWLRSPFVGFGLREIEGVLGAENPVGRLSQDFPEIHLRLTALREAVRTPPLEALKFLIRDPFIGGGRYVDFLTPRARENVDALLFTVASSPPGEVGVLLERLEHLSRQADAGDVPQGGRGVKLLSVHRAKGLEWPVVALFDTGRKRAAPPTPLLVAPQSGRVALSGTPAFDALQRAARTRERGEDLRLLYVGVSRARDALLLTGSVKSGRAEGWAEALAALSLGPDETPRDRPEFALQTHRVGAVAPTPPAREATPVLGEAPWTHRHFSRHPRPPVSSPSSLKPAQKRPAQRRAHADLDDPALNDPALHDPFLNAPALDGSSAALPNVSGAEYELPNDEPLEGEPLDYEPLPISDPDEGERLPGRGRTVGTLLHYAVSQNWSATNPTHLRNLKAQELMFPFGPAEQDDILREVALLLGHYEALLGSALPALRARRLDYAELPLALPYGGTVWQGLIDRLYCVGESWYLDDYKTDQEVAPERYHLQLALYARAVTQVRGVTPTVRLVYLRAQHLVELNALTLERSLAAALGPTAQRSG